jgi:hypothetical protein
VANVDPAEELVAFEPPQMSGRHLPGGTGRPLPMQAPASRGPHGEGAPRSTVDSCWQSPWLRKSRVRRRDSHTCHSHSHADLRQTGQRGHSTAFARQRSAVVRDLRLTTSCHPVSEAGGWFTPDLPRDLAADSGFRSAIRITV